MLSFIQRVQSSTWGDLYKQSKSSQTPAPTIVSEKSADRDFTAASQAVPRSTPKLESPFDDDAALSRIIDAFVPLEARKRADEELSVFAEALVSQQVAEWIADTERHTVHVQHWDAWGENRDVLVTSQGWKYLWQLGTSERLAALPSLNTDYAGCGRVIQMLKVSLFAPSSATSGFHLILSDGVAALLQTHLAGSKIDKATRDLFRHAYGRLTCNEPLRAWTSGLWMTERGGGSDLTPTETTATYSPLGADHNSKDAAGFSLGPWVLNGLKWFSTGTEASMAVAVARTSNGLSAFFVPMYRTVLVNGVAKTELNGVRIRRLKKKVGTKALPTSELELQGMRGWLIGKEGKGIQEIGVVLNVTRIHLAVGVLGYAGRALSATRALARVRKVARGTRLSSVPLHMRTLAKLHITYRAQMMLAFFVSSLLGKSEQLRNEQADGPLNMVPKNSQDASCLLRLLGSVTKASAAMVACNITQSGMESLGGVGYLEDDEGGLNVARLWRDTAATLVGEGTTDVVATDVVKVLKGKIGSYVMAAFGRWISASMPKQDSVKPEAATLLQEWTELKTAISANDKEMLTVNAREIMEKVCRLSAGILLLADATRDADPIAMEVARRYIHPSSLLSGLSVEQGLKLDQQIVFGQQPTWLGLP